MVSIKAVRGLPRLRAPALFLALSLSLSISFALTVSNSPLFIPALLRTHSFVFFAVDETYKFFLSPFITKASRVLLQATLALSLVVSSLKLLFRDFSKFSAVTPDRLPPV